MSFIYMCQFLVDILYISGKNTGEGHEGGKKTLKLMTHLYSLLLGDYREAEGVSAYVCVWFMFVCIVEG